MPLAPGPSNCRPADQRTSPDTQPNRPASGTLEGTRGMPQGAFGTQGRTVHQTSGPADPTHTAKAAWHRLQRPGQAPMNAHSKLNTPTA